MERRRQLYNRRPVFTHSNPPTGSANQKFYFNNPWEPKHAIGHHHKKINEISTACQLANVEERCRGQYDIPIDHYGFLVFQGKPSNCDKAMVMMKQWLEEEQDIQHSDPTHDSPFF